MSGSSWKNTRDLYSPVHTQYTPPAGRAALAMDSFAQGLGYLATQTVDFSAESFRGVLPGGAGLMGGGWLDNAGNSSFKTLPFALGKFIKLWCFAGIMLEKQIDILIIIMLL